MEKTYHVGLRAEGALAVFEFRRCIDFLSCELLEYVGERQTTKSAARRRLKEGKVAALRELNERHPGRNFTRVVVD